MSKRPNGDYPEGSSASPARRPTSKENVPPQPSRGIRDPRGPRASRAMLDEPRKAANRDWLAAERRRLWLNANPLPLSWKPAERRDYPYFKVAPQTKLERAKSSLSGVFVVAASPGKAPPATASEPAKQIVLRESHDFDRAGTLTALVYRYTKQVDLVNDDMGYGERIIEPYFQPEQSEAQRLKRVIRVSQRTKTGRQELLDLRASEALVSESPKEEKT